MTVGINQLWEKGSLRKKAVFDFQVLAYRGIRSYDPLGRGLSAIDGVSRVDVDYLKGRVWTEFDPNVVTVGQIVQVINSCGFRTNIPTDARSSMDDR